MKRILNAPILFTGLALASLIACTHTPSVDSGGLATKTFNAPSSAESVEFIKHDEDKPWKAYLAMNLDPAPYKKLKEEVEAAEGITLQDRGEAHITVVSPVEYDNILKKKLSIAEITKIAEKANIQAAPFTPVCVGRGQKEIDGKIEKTYFVVVESPHLIDLRGLIEEAYTQKGGRPLDFVPEKFYSHVTLGYTLRDLHYEDGVKKDRSSCIYNFK